MKRLNEVVGSLISHVQIAFIKRKYIMEGVFILHEALNTIHTKKTKCYAFQSGY